MKIYTNGHISISGVDTGLGVFQTGSETFVYNRNTGKSVEMPHSRYTLTGATFHPGVESTERFHADICAILEAMEEQK